MRKWMTKAIVIGMTALISVENLFAISIFDKPATMKPLLIDDGRNEFYKSVDIADGGIFTADLSCLSFPDDDRLCGFASSTPDYKETLMAIQENRTMSNRDESVNLDGLTSEAVKVSADMVETFAPSVFGNLSVLLGGSYPKWIAESEGDDAFQKIVSGAKKAVDEIYSGIFTHGNVSLVTTLTNFMVMFDRIPLFLSDGSTKSFFKMLMDETNQNEFQRILEHDRNSSHIPYYQESIWKLCEVMSVLVGDGSAFDDILTEAFDNDMTKCRLPIM